MNKLTVLTLTALLVCTIFATPLNAAKDPIKTTIPSIPNTEAQALINRLDEINAMNKAPLSKTEKRELRKEVRTIKKELTESNGGIYLSVGAIIIIILLLILLL